MALALRLVEAGSWPAGRVARGCHASLDMFAADVDLPEGFCLESVVRQDGSGQVAVELLDASGARIPLTGDLIILLAWQSIYVTHSTPELVLHSCPSWTVLEV